MGGVKHSSTAGPDTFYRPPVSSRKYTSFNINEILSRDVRQVPNENVERGQSNDEDDDELDVDVQQFDYHHAPSMFASSAHSKHTDLSPPSSAPSSAFYFTYGHHI